jgi:hypothetical protein
MNVSDIFGLIIDIYRALIMLVQVISTTSFAPLLFGIPALLLGVWFLRGAPQLMSFSYPRYKINEK